MGEARLAQDAQIQSRFLAGWSTTLNTNLMFATRARKGVEIARLSLDATKGKAKGAAAGRGMNPDEEMMSEDARHEIEQKEDDFVAQTEEAVGVMKNVSPPRVNCSTSLVLIGRCRCWILPNRFATWPT